MSVASTKAFYSQIAAGFLLGIAISESVHVVLQIKIPTKEETSLLLGLKELPSLMKCFQRRGEYLRLRLS